MRTWLEELKNAPVKKTMPILSFPAVQLLGISVNELISDSDRQAKGMQLVAEHTEQAKRSVEGAFGRPEFLCALADSLAKRKN